MKRAWNPALVAALVLGAGVVLVLGWVTFAAQSLPQGPVTPVWDKQACAHCRMHLGEPPFVAQLQTAGGDVLFYDDPGCLARHLAESEPRVHAIWFRHLREARWVPLDAVGFVRVDPTPMGFGHGAVDAGTPGAIPWSAFRAAVVRTAEAAK